MAVTIASISESGGNTTITIDYNGTFISDAAGAGISPGLVFYYGTSGLPVASTSGANITLTGQWSPTPTVGAAIGPGHPMGVIYVYSYSYDNMTGQTTITLYENGDPYTGSVNIGDLFEINGEPRPVVSIDGGGTFHVTGDYTGNVQNAVVTIVGGGGGGGGRSKPSFPEGGRVPEIDLLPSVENRVPEEDLTPDVRDVPREDLVPEVINKGTLIPS